MTEHVFASIGKNGMTVTPLTGASGALGHLYALGQQLNGNTGERQLTYNYNNLMIHNGANHSKRRGLNLAIFDQSMNVVFMATYDIYGDTVNACKSLSDKIKAITSTQLGVFTSYDAMLSNEELDATMNAIRADNWPGTFQLSNSPRTSYVAVYCGKKKAVVAEKTHGYLAPMNDAVIEIAFNDPLTIGHSGFGFPIIDDNEIHESDGTADHVIKWVDDTLVNLNLKAGDSFLFVSLGEIDDIAKTAGKNLEYRISYYNSSNALIRSNIHRITSVEGWEEVTIRDTIPDATTKLMVIAERVIAAGGSNQGTIYVKNTAMHLSDNTAVQTSGVSIGLYGTSVVSYEDSLGGFGQYDPNGYYEAYKAESNLALGKTARVLVDQPVNWFNLILDKPTERYIVKSSGTDEIAINNISIESDKWYYLCVWVNRKIKDAGQMRLAISQLNSGGAIVPTSATDRSGSGNRLYAQMPDYDSLETRQWYLLQGFILPHDITTEEAIKFIDENKEFYGWDDVYGTGIGVSDEGNGVYGWISNQSANSLNIYFEDADNTTESETAWALPILRELKTGSIDIDDGLLTSISITG